MAGITSAGERAAADTFTAARAAPPPSPPDVIVVMTDDQRMGTEKGMPYLWGELRRQSTYYPNAFVPTNQCCPARATFLSGQYAHTTGVWDNTYSSKASEPSGGALEFTLSGYERRTLPQALARRGYRTVLLGKYLNQYSRFNNPLLTRPPGWTDFRTFIGNDGYWSPPHMIAGVPEEGYTTDTLGNAAVDVISSAPSRQPLFLVYSPKAPHAPADGGPYRGSAAATGALARMRQGGEWTNPAVGEVDRSDKPPWVRRIPALVRDEEPNSPFPQVRSLSENQADTLMAVDANIRKIVAAQQTARDWQNTLFVFMSDNGYAWGDHALFGKTTPYRLINGIPLLVKYPSAFPDVPSRDPRLINQIDVTATIAAVTSARLSTAGRSAIDGKPRRGLLLESPASREAFEFPHPAYCGWRTKRAFYVRYGDGSEELYDTARDPYELVNLASRRGYRDLRRSLLEKATLACRPAPPGYSAPTPGVRVRPAANRTQLRVNVNPNLTNARRWRIVAKRQGKQGKWRAVSGPHATRVPEQTLVLDLPKGVYRVTVLPRYGFARTTSRSVRLRG